MWKGKNVISLLKLIYNSSLYWLIFKYQFHVFSNSLTVVSIFQAALSHLGLS